MVSHDPLTSIRYKPVFDCDSVYAVSFAKLAFDESPIGEVIVCCLTGIWWHSLLELGRDIVTTLHAYTHQKCLVRVQRVQKMRLVCVAGRESSVNHAMAYTHLSIRVSRMCPCAWKIRATAQHPRPYSHQVKLCEELGCNVCIHVLGKIEKRGVLTRRLDKP